MFRRIASFVAVAEEGSFTAAARRLNIAQPWLTVQIKQLEQSFGFALFTRGRQGAQLTEEGRQIYEAAKRLREAYDDLQDTVSSVRGEANEKLILFCDQSTIADETRNGIISDFIKHNKNTSLIISNKIINNIFDGLAAGAADIAYGPFLAQDDRFEMIAVSHDEIVLLVPKNHALAAAEHVKGEQIEHQQVLVGNPDSSYVCGFFEQFGIYNVDWTVPPDSEYSSRPYMVEAMNLPAAWVDFPNSRHLLPSSLLVKKFNPPIFCDHGFLYMKNNPKKIVSRFSTMVRNRIPRELLTN